MDIELTPKRTVPYNVEAEQALLGSLLLNNQSFENVSEFLLPKHFSNSIHGKIFDAIRRLVERGEIADPITLKGFFQGSRDLDQVGGDQYLVQLVASVLTISNVGDYGRLVYDLYLRRQLIHLGEGVVNDASSIQLDDSAIKQIEKAEAKLFDLANIGQFEDRLVTFEKALTSAIKTTEAAFKRDSSISGVTTGFVDLDHWLGGLHSSDLIILAGRPSMGKTALATNIAYNAAVAALKQKSEGCKIAFFSLEMSAEQLASRLLAQECNISSDRLRRGKVKAEDFTKFAETSRQMSKIPFFIDDTPALSVSALRTRARRLKRQHDIGMIVIDYLQLLLPPEGKRTDSRVQEISEITRTLKAIAKELNVPVIALSQLSRAVEQREDKRPQLADLRESGSIEQDADVVMFIYREEYYESRANPPEGTEEHITWQKKMERIHNLADVIISKQRHGPIGTVRLFFNSSITKFDNFVEG